MNKDKRYNRRLRMLEEKKYIRMDAELDRLRNVAHDSYIEEEVDPPLQDGYVRYYKIRSDIEKTKEGEELKEVLALVGIREFSKDRLFLSYKDEYLYYRSKRYRKHGYKKPLGLQSLSEYKFDRIPVNLKKYFNKVRRDVPGWGWKEYYIYECNVPRWKFVEKIEKHYIRSRKVLVDGAQSEYDRLHNFIYRNELWPKIYKAKGWSYNHKDDRDNRIKSKIEKLLDKEMYED